LKLFDRAQFNRKENPAMSFLAKASAKSKEAINQQQIDQKVKVKLRKEQK